jgi:hypothetical protein
MSKQSFTTGQVLTAAQVNSLQANDFNQTVSVKTANYTLAATDKGTRIEFNTSGSVTCTVNSGLFDAGDTLVIQNRGAGTATITAGTATVNTSASLALAQYSAGTLYFVSDSAALFLGYATPAPSGASFVGCSLFDTSATQTIATGTNVALTWDSESFDSDGFHSTSSNTSRITIPAGKGGKYEFNGFSFYAANATGVRVAKLFKNGAELYESNFNKGDGTNFTVINISAIIDLVATDYIEFVTLQNSGGNLNAYKNNAPFYGWFSAQYLGA